MYFHPLTECVNKQAPHYSSFTPPTHRETLFAQAHDDFLKDKRGLQKQSCFFSNEMKTRLEIMIPGDLINSKPISNSCVGKARTKFREIKIVHSGTKQNIYCKLNEIHTKLSVKKKKLKQKKISTPPPLPKKYNGLSLTCLV